MRQVARLFRPRAGGVGQALGGAWLASVWLQARESHPISQGYEPSGLLSAPPARGLAGIGDTGDGGHLVLALTWLLVSEYRRRCLRSIWWRRGVGKPTFAD